MRRAVACFAAFTGLGARFAGTLLLAAVLLGVAQAGATGSDEGMFGMVTASIVEE